MFINIPVNMESIFRFIHSNSIGFFGLLEINYGLLYFVVRLTAGEATFNYKYYANMLHKTQRTSCLLNIISY
ncbi:hypothetical protein HanIR_Chr16g0842211 [Helianthus annuus]|nr:hypothetical protein HanIR_Chr16g0842211 [Helianthus annuus]